MTRNLIRRLARAVFAEHLAQIPAGQWLVRLRSPFGAREFVSASSQALVDAVQGELERLVGAIGRRAMGRAS